MLDSVALSFIDKADAQIPEEFQILENTVIIYFIYWFL